MSNAPKLPSAHCGVMWGIAAGGTSVTDYPTTDFGSMAAPRMPLESPCLARKTGV
jgi:hypothetical protein